nr:PTS sugar transporter subunit IIA [Sphingobium subterraneum]
MFKMNFQDLIVPQALSSGATLGSKKQLFQKLGDMAHNAYGLDAGAVYDRLMERERLGSTGFGGGIAIPHAKIDGLTRVYGLVLRLETPLAFDAVDDAPVDIIFSLLSPMDSGAEHLKTLARVSRYLRNAVNTARLRGAGSDEAMFALLTGDEARDAA